MSDSKMIIGALNRVLSDNGFKKKSNNWYWENNEVVLLVNLQKSQYGKQFYINCAVLIKSLSDNKYPKEEQCHIRFRLSPSDTNEQSNKIELLLDLDNQSFSDIERGCEISRILQESGLPLLNQCTSFGGIAETVNGEQSKTWAIRKSVYDWIASNSTGKY
jgi:hypothetical protein